MRPPLGSAILDQLSTRLELYSQLPWQVEERNSFHTSAPALAHAPRWAPARPAQLLNYATAILRERERANAAATCKTFAQEKLNSSWTFPLTPLSEGNT